MRWIEQSKNNDVDGDCLASCLSSITGLDVPSFIPSPRWFGLTKEWLAEHGWSLDDDDGTRPQPGYSLAVGASPTFKNANHATVAFNGEVVWDPSPHRNDPGRQFTPLQWLPVFRLDSGRVPYDPFADVGVRVEPPATPGLREEPDWAEMYRLVKEHTCRWPSPDDEEAVKALAQAIAARGHNIPGVRTTNGDARAILAALSGPPATEGEPDQ